MVENVIGVIPIFSSFLFMVRKIVENVKEL